MCSVSNPGRGEVLLHFVQSCSGVHLTSNPVSTRATSLGVTRSGRDAAHSPPTSAEDKKRWIYTSTSPYAFIAQCLVS
jgi:hypothetical protein